jgi:hypothetical protein
MNRIKINSRCLIGLWPLLGFKRGMDSYDYNYSKNAAVMKKPNHLLIDKIGWGICSAGAYINPVTFLYVLYKEVYRLEVNIRGLEEDKKTDYYNEVI